MVDKATAAVKADLEAAARDWLAKRDAYCDAAKIAEVAHQEEFEASRSLKGCYIITDDCGILRTRSDGTVDQIPPEDVIDIRTPPPASDADFAAKEESYKAALRMSEERIRELEVGYEKFEKMASNPLADGAAAGLRSRLYKLLEVLENHFCHATASMHDVEEAWKEACRNHEAVSPAPAPSDAAVRLSVLIERIKSWYGHGWGAPARGEHQMLQAAVAVAEALGPVVHPAEARVKEFEAERNSLIDRVKELEPQLEAADKRRVELEGDIHKFSELTLHQGEWFKELASAIRGVCQRIENQQYRTGNDWLIGVRNELLRVIELPVSLVPSAPPASSSPSSPPEAPQGWIDGPPTHEGVWERRAGEGSLVSYGMPVRSIGGELFYADMTGSWHQLAGSSHCGGQSRFVSTIE